MELGNVFPNQHVQYKKSFLINEFEILILKKKIMKNIFSIFLLAITSTVFSQVIIGNTTGTATNKAAVLLDFAAGQNKGIILPYVQTLPSGPGLVEGTIVLDATNPLKAKVLYYNGTPTWFDLSSRNTADISSKLIIQPTTIKEDVTARAIIGAKTSEADGVLVLESSTKAMVLPMVEKTADVKDPAPGMMVYVNKAGGKRLAVFNGANWTFWKP